MVLTWGASMAERGAVAKKEPWWGGGRGLMCGCVILKEPLNHSGPQFPQLDPALPRHHSFIYSQAHKQNGNLKHKWLPEEVNQDYELMRPAQQEISIAREGEGCSSSLQLKYLPREGNLIPLQKKRGGKETYCFSLVLLFLFPRG